MLTSTGIMSLAEEAVTEGGSGRGMSFWSDAAQCGKRARFREEEKSQGARAFDPTHEGHFVVGGVYHKLHEIWRYDADVEFSYNEPLENRSVLSAIELFNGWRGQWNRDFWGKTVAVERQLPCTEIGEKTIVEALGTLVTAKVDMCVDIAEDDLERIQARCPDIVEAGRYLVDWKTAASHYPKEYYAGGLQALWYPAAWEMEHEDAVSRTPPIIGTIFDVIIKPRHNAKDRTFSREKFAAHFVPYQRGSFAAIQGLILQGQDNLQRAVDKDLGNRAECVKFSFGSVDVCPFYGNRCMGE